MIDIVSRMRQTAFEIAAAAICAGIVVAGCDMLAYLGTKDELSHALRRLDARQGMARKPHQMARLG